MHGNVIEYIYQKKGEMKKNGKLLHYFLKNQGRKSVGAGSVKKTQKPHY